jgi:hypothetical protein
MNATKAIESREESKKLPLGHYERKRAKERVDKIYRRCHEQEASWEKRLKRYLPKDSLTLKQARKLVDKVCEALHIRRIRRIVIKSCEVPAGAGACYFRGEIHFPSSYIRFSSLMHELSHVEVYDHGDDFLEVEELVFLAAEQILKGGLFRHKYGLDDETAELLGLTHEETE